MKQIMLEVDDLDYSAIQKAIARRQRFRCMPDADGGNIIGQIMEEICRGWLDLLDSVPATDYLGLDDDDDGDPPDPADWWKDPS